MSERRIGVEHQQFVIPDISLWRTQLFEPQETYQPAFKYLLPWLNHIETSGALRNLQTATNTYVGVQALLAFGEHASSGYDSGAHALLAKAKRESRQREYSPEFDQSRPHNWWIRLKGKQGLQGHIEGLAYGEAPVGRDSKGRIDHAPNQDELPLAPQHGENWAILARERPEVLLALVNAIASGAITSNIERSVSLWPLYHQTSLRPTNKVELERVLEEVAANQAERPLGQHILARAKSLYANLEVLASDRLPEMIKFSPEYLQIGQEVAYHSQMVIPGTEDDEIIVPARVLRVLEELGIPYELV